MIYRPTRIVTSPFSSVLGLGRRPQNTPVETSEVTIRNHAELAWHTMIDAVRATYQPAAALLSWHQSPSRLPIMWMVSTILNISSRLVVVGTGLVANAERDTFKLKVSPESPSLEEQVRARPKFAMFAVAAAASSNTLHPPSQPPQTSSSGQPSSDLPLQPPQPPQTSSSTGQSAPTPSHSLSRLRQLPRPPNLPRQLNHPWSRSLSGVAC